MVQDRGTIDEVYHFNFTNDFGHAISLQITQIDNDLLDQLVMSVTFPRLIASLSAGALHHEVREFCQSLIKSHRTLNGSAILSSISGEIKLRKLLSKSGFSSQMRQLASSLALGWDSQAILD